MDQGQATGFVARIEHVDQAKQLVRQNRSPNLEGDRIADAAEVFDMRAVYRGGTHSDPWDMRPEVEPGPLPWHFASERLFVRQEQRFVRSVEVDAIEVVHLGAG